MSFGNKDGKPFVIFIGVIFASNILSDKVPLGQYLFPYRYTKPRNFNHYQLFPPNLKFMP
jgi:hypothetical protein